jgi:hypothetical protein
MCVSRSMMRPVTFTDRENEEYSSSEHKDRQRDLQDESHFVLATWAQARRSGTRPQTTLSHGLSEKPFFPTCGMGVDAAANVS